MTEKKKPTEVFFPFRIQYNLTKAGQRESLLRGGDGRESQFINDQISLADAEALGEGLNSSGNLIHGYCEIRTAEYRYNFSTRTWDNTDIGDFKPAYYDAPQEFTDLLADALRYHTDRQIIFEALKMEREAVKQSALRGEIDFDSSSATIYIDQAGKRHKFQNDPELNALAGERFRKRQEVEAAAKAKREADDLARKQAKTEQIAAWITTHGSQSQRERFAAGLFPETEAIEAIEQSAFAPIADLALYKRITEAEVRATCSDQCRCSSDYDEKPCEVTCKSETVETVTDKEWERMKRITALLPGAVVTLKSHYCQCADLDCDPSEGEGVIERKGLYVKLQVGGFTFNREYAVE